MPRSSGSDGRNMRPMARSSSLTITSAWSTLPEGRVSGTTAGAAPATAARASARTASGREWERGTLIVPIVPSRSARIQDLLGRLASGGPAERDSAVAGLTLLGARVVEPLRAMLPTASPAARLAALEVLERLDDRAALAPLLDLVRDDDAPVARRAMEAVGGRPDPRAARALAAVLAGPAPASRRLDAARALVRLQAAGLVEALDPLAARLLDEREEAGLRVAILDALRAQEPPLAPATLRPLLKRLAASADPQLAARAHPATDAHVPLERLVDELVLPGRSAEAVARTTAALAGRGAPAIPALQRGPRASGPAGPRRRGRPLAPGARRDPRGARGPRQPGRPLRSPGDDRERPRRRHARAPSGRRPGRRRLARSRARARGGGRERPGSSLAPRPSRPSSRARSCARRAPRARPCGRTTAAPSFSSGRPRRPPGRAETSAGPAERPVGQRPQRHDDREEAAPQERRVALGPGAVLFPGGRQTAGRAQAGRRAPRRSTRRGPPPCARGRRKASSGRASRR